MTIIKKCSLLLAILGFCLTALLYLTACPECSQDDQCGDNQICDYNSCRDLCTSDADCDDSHHCVPRSEDVGTDQMVCEYAYDAVDVGIDDDGADTSGDD